MSVIVASRKFYDVDFVGDSGGGTDTFDAGIFNKIKCVIAFDCFRSLENRDIVFTASDKKITIDPLDGPYSFIQDGWKVGATLTVVGGANAGIYTTAIVSDLYLVTEESLSDETGVSISLFDDTPVTKADFFYNLIRNNFPESYLSLTNPFTIQKFTASGLDANSSTPVLFKVATASRSWVTNNLSDEDTGETDEVSIKGTGIADHKQSFELTQIFTVAPFWKAEQYQNFLNLFPPDYFAYENALKHIFKIEASGDGVVHNGGISDQNGKSAWFNITNTGAAPDYRVIDVKWFDVATSAFVDTPDFNRQVRADITITSASGAFDESPETVFVIDFLYCALNRLVYENGEKTLRKNLLNDRVVLPGGSGSPDNGEYFGTAYQVLTDVAVTGFATDEVTISATLDLSTEIKEMLKLVDDSDRNFAIVITTQDVAITTSEQSDRVSLLATFTNFDYDRTNADLLEVVDSIHCFHYPQADEYETSFKAAPGQPLYLQFPFQVETAEVNEVRPTLNDIAIQIVAVKAGQDDFILEERKFITADTKKVNGTANIQISETRDFNLPAGSPFNTVILERNTDYDSGTLAGYLLTYSFVARYEYWYSLLNPNPFDLDNPTQNWEDLIGFGWSLKVKFVANVAGYDGFVTNFWGYTDLEFAETDPDIDIEIKYFNESGLEVKQLLTGERTLIQVRFTGNTDVPIGYERALAYLFADYTGTGGQNQRRIASTEADSEDDSPFEAGYSDPEAVASYASANVVLNQYDGGTDPDTYVLSTWYDETKQKWGVNGLQPIVYANFGYLKPSLRMLFESGEPMIFETLEPMDYDAA